MLVRKLGSYTLYYIILNINVVGNQTLNFVCIIFMLSFSYFYTTFKAPLFYDQFN